MATETSAGYASLSLDAARERLQELERERDQWMCVRLAKQKWVEEAEQQLQERRKHELPLRQPENAPVAGVNGASPPPAWSPTATVGHNGSPSATMVQKSEELKQLTLRLAKTHKQIATMFTNQLRTIREKDAAKPTPVSTAPTQSPTHTRQGSSTQPPTSAIPVVPAKRPTNKHNVLVLAPVTTTALGKRLVLEAERQVTVPTYPTLEPTRERQGRVPAELLSIVLRLAVRHFLRTGKKLPLAEVNEKMASYVGRALTEGEVEELWRDASTQWKAVVDGVGDRPTHQRVLTRVRDERQIQAWVDLEKAQLDEISATWATSSVTSDARVIRLLAAVNALAFTSEPSLEALLQSVIRSRATEPGCHVVTSAQPHLAPELSLIKYRLQTVHPQHEAHQQSTHAGRSASFFQRPFDLERDSVMKQVNRDRPGPRKRRRADPMKVLCMFELSGVCNDSNCPYQHQRDLIQDQADASDDSPNDSTQELIHDTTRSVVNQFMQLRGELRKQWPSLAQILQTNRTDGTMIDTPQAKAVVQSSHTSSLDGSHGSDFIALDEESSDGEALHDVRYCLSHEGHDTSTVDQGFSTDELQRHVISYPTDVDAWLLLALRTLELEVSISDEQAWMPAAARLKGELQALHSLLSRSRAAPRKANVESCLKTLSKALEIEDNAYCEELWLLHLHLSRFLPAVDDNNLQGELEMAEQALNFVPGSVSLWRHFLLLRSTSVGTLDAATESSRVLLQAIATISQGVKGQRTKDAFSVLLCDIILHACALYCNAGVSEDAVSFLQVFLCPSQTQGETSTQSDPTMAWCSSVREQMIGDDILVLYVLLVHLQLLGTMPRLLVQRGFSTVQTVDVYQLLLPFDRTVNIERVDTSPVLTTCERAFQEFQGAQDLVPPGIEVLLHNWVLVVARSGQLSTSDQLNKLTIFQTRQLPTKTILPRVLTVLAYVYRHVYDKHKVADGVVDTLAAPFLDAATSSPVGNFQRFGEALYHFLLQRPHHFVGDPFAQAKPSLPLVVACIASIASAASSGESSSYSTEAIHAIANEPSAKLQQKNFAKMIQSLMRDTLAYIVSSQAGASGGHVDSDEQDIAHDTYFLMAQVLLLRQVCDDPGLAIDALERIVMQRTSTSWRVLPVECRRMIWSTRLLLQGDPGTGRNPTEFARQVVRFLGDVGSYSAKPAAEYIHVESDAVTAGGVPEMRHAIAACCKIEKPRVSMSGFEMQLLEICAVTLSQYEMSSHVAPILRSCGHDQAFLARFSDLVHNANDQRQVLAALRRLVYRDTSPLLPEAFRILVAADAKQKNVRGIKNLLAHRLKVDPLDSVVWDMIATLEVLFGPSAPSRAEEFVSALIKTNGVRIVFHSCLHASVRELPVMEPSTVQVNLRATLIERVPTTLLATLRDHLQVLDLSNNLLVTLPRTISVLKQLRELRLSGNALVSLPLSIGQLQSLRVVELAHNNLTLLPNAFWDGLLQLRRLDLRFNALQGVNPRVVRLTLLQSLRIEGNAFEWKAFEAIHAKLPQHMVVDMDPSCRQEEAEDVEEMKAGESSEEDEDVEMKVIVPRRIQDHPDQDGDDLRPSKDEDASVSVDLTGDETQPTSPENAQEASTANRSIETPSSSSPPPALELVADVNRSPSQDTESDDDEVEFLGSTRAPVVTSNISTLLRGSGSSEKADRPSSGGSPAVDEPKNPDRSAAEWRKFVDDNVLRETHYGPCVLCRAPNEARTHQQFGMVTMCVGCIRDAVAVLEARTAGKA